MRSGRILELVKERLGDYAATVVSTILSLGHAKVSHLETLRELQPPGSGKGRGKQKPNGVNGIHSSEASEPVMNGGSSHSSHSKLHATLRSLSAHGYIIRVLEAQFRSPADNYYDAEKVVKSRAELKSLKGAKLQEAIDEGISHLIKERTDGTLSQGWMSNGVPRGIKRRAATTETRPNKRSKLQNAVEDDEDEDAFSDDNDFDDAAPMDVSYPDYTTLQKTLLLTILLEQLGNPH